MPDALRSLVAKWRKEVSIYNVEDDQRRGEETVYERCADELESAMNAEPPAVPSRESELETALRWALSVMKVNAEARYGTIPGSRYRCDWCTSETEKSPEKIKHHEDCRYAAAKRLLGNTGRKAAPPVAEREKQGEVGRKAAPEETR